MKLLFLFTTCTYVLYHNISFMNTVKYRDMVLFECYKISFKFVLTLLGSVSSFSYFLF